MLMLRKNQKLMKQIKTDRSYTSFKHNYLVLYILTQYATKHKLTNNYTFKVTPNTPL